MPTACEWMGCSTRSSPGLHRSWCSQSYGQRLHYTQVHALMQRQPLPRHDRNTFNTSGLTGPNSACMSARTLQLTALASSVPCLRLMQKCTHGNSCLRWIYRMSSRQAQRACSWSLRHSGQKLGPSRPDSGRTSRGAEMRLLQRCRA